MSRNNKVNPDHYKLAGRLTPDELARQRVQQGAQQLEGGRGHRGRGPLPPWMLDQGTQQDHTDADAGAGMPRRSAAQRHGATASRKGSRPAPRRKTTGDAVGTARRTTPKASGARGTPKSGKSPASRGSAARNASPQRGRAKKHG